MPVPIPPKTFEGPAAGLDTLVAEAAEATYAQTQPYRYASVSAAHGKPDEALAAYQRLARSRSPDDQQWAYAGWSLKS